MSTNSKDSPETSKRGKPDADYEVGYCRPPRSTRWPKNGPSPNPRGRPRKHRPTTPDDIVNQVSQSTIPIMDGGVLADVTRFEALVLKLFAAALSGDRKAQKEILSLRQRYMPPARPALEDDDEALTFVMAGADAPDPDEPPAPTAKRRRLTRAERGMEGRRATFNRVAARSISVVEAGVRRKVSFEQALWQFLYADALKGDVRAQALIARYTDRIDPSGIGRRPDPLKEPENMTFTLYIGDKTIITADEPAGNDPDEDI